MSHEESAVELIENRRMDAANLTVSETMKEALIEEEGVRYTVYRDAAGYPTVGVGHLVTGQDKLSVGDTISKSRAIELLDEDLKYAERVVLRLVGDLPLYQHEFDALVDLAFNVGEGTLSVSRSPKLNSAIEARDYESVGEQLDYLRAGNTVPKGLALRSERRAQIFADGDYSNPRA